MMNKSLKENDIIQLLNDGYKSDLSDFSENDDEQFDLPADEIDLFLQDFEFLIMKMMIAQK